MLKVATVLAVVAGLSILVAIAGRYGLRLGIGSPYACLVFAQSCAQLGILALLIGWACGCKTAKQESE